MIIGVVAVVAVVAILVLWMIFAGSSSLVGRWDGDYAEYTYEDPWSGERVTETENIDGYIKFNSDGTGESEMFGYRENFEWEDKGGGILEISDPDGTEEISYSISGSTLTFTIEETMYGETYTYKMVFQKA